MNRVRALAGECMAILKNDGTLPLKETGNVALYGSGARRTVKGGTGSGDVNSRYVVSIEDGLEDAGFQVKSKEWLSRYDEIRAEARAEYDRNLKKQSEETGMPEFSIQIINSDAATSVGTQAIAYYGCHLTGTIPLSILNSEEAMLSYDFNFAYTRVARLSSFNDPTSYGG